MAARFTMSWEPKHRRWWKLYLGQRYVVSCRQLKKHGYLPLAADETKSASATAANKWLADKLGNAEPRVFGSLISQLETRRDWLKQNDGDAAVLDKVIGLLRQRKPLDPSPLVLPQSSYDAILSPSDEVWDDRLSRYKKSSTMTLTLSVGDYVEQFLSLRRSEVSAGNLSSRTYDNVVLYMKQFSAWCGESVESIDSAKWISFYQHLLNQPLSNASCRSRFSYTRSFIHYLIEVGAVKPFESLHSRRYQFAHDRSPVEPLPVSEVMDLLSKATGILRLFVLLMLNTGCTQVDISDMTPSEYVDGCIVRARSKTRRKGTRTVRWVLWRETKALLDLYMQTSGDRLLLTSQGKPWVGAGRTDNVRSIYRAAGFKIPLKRLRQCSGDYIKREFGKDVADHFLAHKMSPTDSAYFSADQHRIDAAILYLETLYGLA